MILVNSFLVLNILRNVNISSEKVKLKTLIGHSAVLVHVFPW